jgi:hypothetical protein
MVCNEICLLIVAILIEYLCLIMQIILFFSFDPLLSVLTFIDLIILEILMY